MNCDPAHHHNPAHNPRAVGARAVRRAAPRGLRGRDRRGLPLYSRGHERGLLLGLQPQRQRRAQRVRLARPERRGALGQGGRPGRHCRRAAARPARRGERGQRAGHTSKAELVLRLGRGVREHGAREPRVQCAACGSLLPRPLRRRRRRRAQPAGEHVPRERRPRRHVGPALQPAGRPGARADPAVCANCSLPPPILLFSAPPSRTAPPRAPRNRPRAATPLPPTARHCTAITGRASPS